MTADKNFRRVVLLRESQEADGTRAEYVLRFFAFLHRYRAFDHSVLDFLNTYMQSAAHSFDYEKNRLVFNRSFSELARLLPKGLRRLRELTPVNLFEAVAVGAALALKKQSRLRSVDGLRWLQAPELQKLTTGATNTPAMVVGRIHFAAKHFGAS